MQLHEFYAVPENGIITIPEKYRNKMITRVKVILFDDKPIESEPRQNTPPRKSDLLLAPSLDTKGWKFSREEANER